MYRKKSQQVKYKKAPQAPRRFKSSYMFFSTEKHKSIRKELAEEGGDTKISTTEVAKMVSRAWKDLSDDEREVWEEMARKDRARYEMEKSMYSGPWKVPANEKQPKDPSAPKRPMSAFLSFSNAKRTMVKEKHETMTNAELSRLLAQMWKDTPEDEKAEYVNKEYRLRQEYKVEMTKWRRNSEEAENNARKQREDVAMNAALDGRHLGLENNFRADDSQYASSIYHQYSDQTLVPLSHGSYTPSHPVPYDAMHMHVNGAMDHQSEQNIPQAHHLVPHAYDPQHYAREYTYSYEPASTVGHDHYGYHPQNYAIPHPCMARIDPNNPNPYAGDSSHPVIWPPGDACHTQPGYLYPPPNYDTQVCHPPPQQHYGVPCIDPTSAGSQEKMVSSPSFDNSF